MNKPRTIFCDLDGTLVAHRGTLDKCIQSGIDASLLPGAEEWLQAVYAAGHRLIITTGRPECARQKTEYLCQRVGIYYHQLIMDCTPGVRMIVNDKKDSGTATAEAVNLTRNQGFTREDVEAIKA